MLIRNLGYDPSTRFIRARRGLRYTGVVLPNGVGLPRSSARTLKITAADALEWLDFLLENLQEARIELLSDDGRVLTEQDLLELKGKVVKVPEKSIKTVEKTIEKTVEKAVEKAVEKPKAKKPKIPSADDLQAMKRSELDGLAQQLELDPHQYSNKAALIEAILGLEA